MTGMQPKLLIGGEFLSEGRAPSIPVINPCTEQVLWNAPACSPEDVVEALAHARDAQLTWSQVHGWERGKILRLVERPGGSASGKGAEKAARASGGS